MSTTTFINKVNNLDIFAKRAENTKKGVEIDTALEGIQGKISSTATSENKLTSGTDVDSKISAAIGTLDVSDIGGFGAGRTLATLTETDGKVGATFQDIQIAESQVTNLTTDLGLKAPLASPALTGTPTAPTAATGDDSTQIATTAFVKTAIEQGLATADALTYKGTVAGGDTGDYGALTPAAAKGDVYKVTTAGKIDGAPVEVGDMLICNTDETAAATTENYATIAANWDFIQANLDGAVIGPASSTDGHIALFDGATGKLIKDGAKSLSDFAAADHVHGNISNDGKIGNTAGLAVVTTTDGAVTTTDLSTDAPTASGDALAFIDSISQASNGKISATKKNVTISSSVANADTNPVSGGAVYTYAEAKSNKVTAWSSTTTDTNYPSEKLVKDSLDNKANKDELTITDVSGDSTKKTIQLKSGTSQDVLVAHQDITGKADKVASATSGNFAGLDSNGNLTDSGSKAADFATAAQGSKADSAIQGVKTYGADAALTPDANKVVTIPKADGSNYGVVIVGTVTIAD